MIAYQWPDCDLRRDNVEGVEGAAVPIEAVEPLGAEEERVTMFNGVDGTDGLTSDEIGAEEKASRRRAERADVAKGLSCIGLAESSRQA